MQALSQPPVALEDTSRVGKPTRVLLQHALGLAPAELDQHGALGLVHLEPEGSDPEVEGSACVGALSQLGCR